MTPMGQQIQAVGESHERVLGELVEQAMSIEDLGASTGLSAPMLLGALRVLERGGKVRRTPRGSYELVRSPIVMRDSEPLSAEQELEAALPEVRKRETKPPKPASDAAVQTSAMAAPPAKPKSKPEVTTMAEGKICTKGAACKVSPGKPQPLSAFYKAQGKCKRCFLDDQHAVKAARFKANGHASTPRKVQAKRNPPPVAQAANSYAALIVELESKRAGIDQAIAALKAL